MKEIELEEQLFKNTVWIADIPISCLLGINVVKSNMVGFGYYTHSAHFL